VDPLRTYRAVHELIKQIQSDALKDGFPDASNQGVTDL
jgi:hypothetical protein